MPKDNIDYSNTIIYKIICNDNTINDVYVGHTTNFIQRKYHHKIACRNLHNKLKIYNTIRQNGGWDNWNMVEIAKYNCSDQTEARIKEQQHYEELNANLNSCPPYPKKYNCAICNTGSISKKMYEPHINCDKPKELEMLPKDSFNELNPGLTPKYFCEKCNYATNKKSNINNHNMSSKHLKTLISNNFNTSLSSTYICNICNKKYKDYSGLWRHKKKCKEPNNLNNETISQITPELIMNILQQNKELQQMLIEQNKTIIELTKNSLIINNNNTN
jgi:hypothetical protein